MKTLQILMSTYNGAKYIREQMDSLLDQNCEKLGKAAFRIVIRDDGSSDGTQDILEEYAGRYPEKVSWYQGENHGLNCFKEWIHPIIMRFVIRMITGWRIR